jgi:CheY-like chemotaxis protein
MAKLASVLVIDDNPNCLQFMTLAFSAQAGVQVTGEQKPQTALVRIRNEKPDLVMLDVKMPELDGFGVLAVLRTEGNSVPVVMCSGSVLQQDIDRAYMAGCNGYIEKPATLSAYREMAQAVVNYWQKSELPQR